MGNIIDGVFIPSCMNILTQEEMDKKDREKNIDKNTFALAFYRWYPDRLADVMVDAKGGRRLHHDQRLFMRIMARFYSMTGVYSRSYGKTMLEVLTNLIMGIVYPKSELAISAQTLTNAQKILISKMKDVLDFFPSLKKEINERATSYNKDKCQVVLKNDSNLGILANLSSSKGQRKHALSIEESALIDKYTFEDSLRPIPDDPRHMCNYIPDPNPIEPHRRIDFFTTPYYKASPEYKRILDRFHNMFELQGDFVIGADWHLNAWYGRGKGKREIQREKFDNNPISFLMNYGGKFVGVSQDALVDMAKLLDLRVLEHAEYECDENGEYYMGVDVARRSVSSSSTKGSRGCQTSVTIIKVKRKQNNRISSIELPYIETIFGDELFTDQAIRIKYIADKFKINACILDTNGLGVGLADELMKTQEKEGITYKSWASINTDDKPEEKDSPRLLFRFVAQGKQTQIITHFMGVINSGQLKLLKTLDNTIMEESIIDLSPLEQLPYIHTELLIQEISNLKLVTTDAYNSLTVKQVVAKFGKDRFSGLSYVLWYVKEHTDNVQDDDVYDMADYVFVI